MNYKQLVWSDDESDTESITDLKSDISVTETITTDGSYLSTGIMLHIIYKKL